MEELLGIEDLVVLGPLGPPDDRAVVYLGRIRGVAFVGGSDESAAERALTKDLSCVVSSSSAVGATGIEGPGRR